MLAGDYRIRFRTNGADGWFLRFKITGAGADAKGELTEGLSMLGVDKGPLTAVALDPSACKLTAKFRGEATDDVVLALELDARTGAVKGQMTRARVLSDEEKSVPVTGVRDVGPPPMPAPCFVPGIYKLALDATTRWKNPDDDRSCADQHALDVLLRVEGYGDTVSIEEVEIEPPHEQNWGNETVTRTGCEVRLELTAEAYSLDAKLTFAGDKVTGTVTKAQIQVVVETDESEDIWNCATAGGPLTLTRQP